MSECGAKGETVRWAFKAEAGNRGFQPQSKPPVHTGGFDFYRNKDRREDLCNYYYSFNTRAFDYSKLVSIQAIGTK